MPLYRVASGNSEPFLLEAESESLARVLGSFQLLLARILVTLSDLNVEELDETFASPQVLTLAEEHDVHSVPATSKPQK